MLYPVVGIVAEYNPFHNGHAFHIRSARETTSAQAVVAVLSSDFVQRGGPALLDKHARANMALACGADLVLELPAVFSSQNAGVFARAAVDTLAATGVVTHIAFGAEDPDKLTDSIIDILLNEPSSFKSVLKNCLSDGLSFVEARAAALNAVSYGSAQIIAQSNNSLAVEYLMRIKAKNYKMLPIPVKRIGASHNNAKITDLSSATAIRTAVQNGDIASALRQMPAEAQKILINEAQKGKIFKDTDSYWRTLRAILLRESPDKISSYAEIGEGTEHKFISAALASDTFAEWLDACTSKRYPAGRIRRAAAHIILSFDHWHNRAVQRLGPAYIKPLAMNGTGRTLLHEMKQKSLLPFVSRCGDAAAISSYASRIAEFELMSCEMWRNFVPCGYFGDEHKEKIIIIE
ncbi:MAG: nucleotidyltransferase family protein [Synergistes sp.]|nr:nucleotidyltransferase family protein [Synergistes sp.]